MVDFNKLLKEMNTEEYKQRKKEREEKEELEYQTIKQTACFTGHRPQAKCMFGFNLKDERYRPLYNELVNTIELCINEEGINRFISGGALGVDQIGYWLVHKLKNKYPDIKNIVAVPFKNQDIIWTVEQKQWYKKMLKLADEIIYVDEISEYQVKDTKVGEYHVAKMDMRNHYMVDNSRIVIAVFDGNKGGTANCVRYARKTGKSLFRLFPQNDFKLEISYGMYHIM